MDRVGPISMPRTSAVFNMHWSANATQLDRRINCWNSRHFQRQEEFCDTSSSILVFFLNLCSNLALGASDECIEEIIDVM